MYQEAIIAGIISGVLAYFIIFLVNNIFLNIVIPWYQTIIYKGLDISGTWKDSHDYSSARNDYKIQLSQQAHNVTGDVTIVKFTENEQSTDVRTYYLSGTFFDGYLIASSMNKDSKKKGYITYLLQVSGDGSSMRGIVSWYDTFTDRICSRDAHWDRD